MVDPSCVMAVQKPLVPCIIGSRILTGPKPWADVNAFGVASPLAQRIPRSARSRAYRLRLLLLAGTFFDSLRKAITCEPRANDHGG